jgi:hypothetical protein
MNKTEILELMRETTRIVYSESGKAYTHLFLDGDCLFGREILSNGAFGVLQFIYEADASEGELFPLGIKKIKKSISGNNVKFNAETFEITITKFSSQRNDWLLLEELSSTQPKETSCLQKKSKTQKRNCQWEHLPLL